MQLKDAVGIHARGVSFSWRPAFSQLKLSVLTFIIQLLL